MITKASAILGISLLTLPALADEYVIDTNGAHASISFQVSHLGYSFIKGRFNDFSGTFNYLPNDFTASSVEVTVNTTSLDSNHAERDKHIRSGDFINSSKYETATFRSTAISELNENDFTIDGELTLHGKTKPITIDAILIGEGQDPWGGYRAGFNGSTRLELADFDIPVMGDSSYVLLELHIEGIKQ
ncbi:YceI family protein [Thaumasiovibrio sp. DFM-14]|uniref:YceI family protein n=1 Tax=Thaumasiovibrio sp. DFM-14 TaxID=3384792 RepID=UPI0039A005D5